MLPMPSETHVNTMPISRQMTAEKESGERGKSGVGGVRPGAGPDFAENGGGPTKD